MWIEIQVAETEEDEFEHEGYYDSPQKAIEALLRIQKENEHEV